MANVLGKSFKPFVIEQINTRQEVLSTTVRDQNFLQYVSKTPWLRMASSVSIQSSTIDPISGEKFQNPNLTEAENSVTGSTYNPGREKAKDLGEPNALGNTFARNYVLFGGSLSVTRNDNSDDASPGSDISYSPLAIKFGVNSPEPTSQVNPTLFNDRSYGFGGSDWGQTPMPGLTSIHVQDYNRGAIRKAKVNFTCTNLQQFEILSTLYMRVGYNVLIEWGHTQYLDNQGNIQQRLNFNTPAFTSFFEGSPISTILTDIVKEQENVEGNYDGFIGRVTNFNWKFIKGIYECSIDVLTTGDVIESLKINKNNDEFDQESSEPTPSPLEASEVTSGPPLPKSIDDEKVSSLSVAKSILLTTVATNPAVAIAALVLSRTSSWFKRTFTSAANAAVGNKVNSTKQGELKENSSKEKTNSTKPQIPSFITERDSNVINRILYNKYTELGLVSNAAISSEDGIIEYFKLTDGNTWDYCYVSLGKLLQILEANSLSYDLTSNTPIIFIDSDYESNYCARFPEQVSTDWSKCFIPYEVFNAQRNQSTTNQKINKILGSKDKRYDFKPYTGKLMHILINFKFISDTLANSTDEKGRISLQKFLQEILTGCQISIGNINDFSVGYNYETNSLKIYDNTPLATSQLVFGTKPKIAKFASYGVQKNQKGSFLLDLNLEGTIPSNFANLIAAGAQNNGNQIGENATAFSLFNLGLEDRTRNSDYDIEQYQRIKNENEKQESNLINTFNENKEKLYTLLQKISLNDGTTISSLSSAQNTNIDFSNFYLGRAAQLGKLPGNFFIPFNLSLNMDGLSGMRLFDIFSITNGILPKMYTDSLNFIIAGIGHDITTAGWVTYIDSQTYNQSSETNPTPLPIADPLIPPAETAPLLPEGIDETDTLYPPIRERKSTPSDEKTLARKIVATLFPLRNQGITENIMAGVLFLAFKEQNLKGFNNNYYGVMADVSKWTGGDEFFNGSFSSTEGAAGQGNRTTKFRYFASFETEENGFIFIANTLKRKGWSSVTKDTISRQYFGTWLFGNPDSAQAQALINGPTATLTEGIFKRSKKLIDEASFIQRRLDDDGSTFPTGPKF